ncbi:MAG: terminase small subunit [Christensenellales bacterium]|nr:terminase small subunit [Christensenellales bacterium]
MLTDRQERFCQEYLIDLNATQAYIRAGYSARTAHNCASRLMAKAGVRARIDELMAVRSRRTGVTQERVVRELARIAFVDPTQAIDFECAGLREDAKADDRAALMSVRVKSGDDFTEREVRLYDKVRALELLGKHLGMFTEKVELSGERVRIVDDVPEAARDG